VTRARRTRILVQAAEEVRARCAADVLAAHDVREVQPPTETLVMLTARDTARGSLFHPGELLVTEARARIGEHVGLGIAAGSCAQKAWELAVIDAAYTAGVPECATWEQPLQEEEQRLQREREKEDARILQTRVEFETMDIT